MTGRSGPVIDRTSMFIDLRNGGRVILGLDRSGRLHSGAFNRDQAKPFVHDGHFEVPEERVSDIFSAADRAFPAMVDNEYVTDEAVETVEVTFFSGDEGRTVGILGREEMEKAGKDLGPCPMELWTFVRMLWDENRW